MKKILFVVDERNTGGVSIVLENIINSFPKINFDILVLHNRGDRLTNLPNANIIYGTKFFDVCDMRLSDLIKSKNILKVIKKLYFAFLLKTGLINKKIIKERRKIFKNDNYDVEICFKDGFGTYFTAYGNSKKKIRWIHSDYSTNNPGEKYMKTYQEAINKYDRIVAISKFVGENFNKLFHREKDTEVIYNIIDTTKSLPTERISKDSDKFELVTVGRLCKEKGYSRVIEAFNRLNQENLLDDVIFKIVGGGPLEQELKDLVHKYNLDDKIIFLGPSTTPWNYLQNGDMFVLSSYTEAFPTTIIESLLNHIPVFSVEYVSAHEILNSKNAVVVKNTDEEIYNGLKNILQNKEKVLELKKNILNYEYKNQESIKKISKLLGVK